MDHIIVLGETHLRRIPKSYVRYTHRPDVYATFALFEAPGNRPDAAPVDAFLCSADARKFDEYPVGETTLDTEARSLLQVKIKEVDEADDILTMLVGDVVEPPREFIQNNSLSATVDV